MASDLLALCFDANDPDALARFWSGVLGWEMADDRDGSVELLPNDDTGFRLRFLPSQEHKDGPNQMHFDLTSQSLEDQQATVDRALSLDGRHLDVGQLPEEKHVVLSDPEGNELCVLPPGNNFLADCGFLGAVSSDGTQALGYFWSKALDWPLVWDQDEETAIRSPHGGPKVTWGGPPMAIRNGKTRLHLDLATTDGDVAGEVERLVSLGATRVDRVSDRDHDGVLLLDLDGNEFWVLRAR